MKRLITTIVFLSVLAVIFIIADRTWDQVEIGQPEKIIIHNNGKSHTISSKSPYFNKILNAAESALASSHSVIKGVAKPPFTESDGMRIAFPRTKNVEILGDSIPVTQVFIPLTGSYYEEEDMVMLGSDSALSQLQSRPWRVWYLKRVVDDYIKNEQ